MAQTLREALTAAVPGVMTAAMATQIGASYEANFGSGALDITYLVPGTVSLSDGVLSFQEQSLTSANVSWKVGDLNGWSKLLSDGVPT